jgi:hypothetical protein
MASQRTAYPEYRVEHSKVKWDPRTIEIRTHSVEKALEPLVQQVSWKILSKKMSRGFAALRGCYTLEVYCKVVCYN